jgi:hypothetical protein
LPHAGNIGGKRQSLAIPFAASGTPQTRDVAYDFVKQNWDELIAKLPNDVVDFLPYIAAGYCDAAHRADADAFFKERVTKTMGGPHPAASTGGHRSLHGQ